jgi:hypothetical protein
MLFVTDSIQLVASTLPRELLKGSEASKHEDVIKYTDDLLKTAKQ